jgi:restriction endonuclease Mrr
MSWSSRVDKKIRANISSSIASSNSISNVKNTTISGYRSLHINQLDRQGYGTKTKYNAKTIDSLGDGGAEDPYPTSEELTASA